MTPGTRIVAGLLLVPSLLVLPACSGDGPGTTTESAGLAGATRAPSPSPSTAPTTSPFAPTSTPPARPAEPRVLALPESELAPVKDHAYEPIEGSPDVPPEFVRLSEYFAGYVGRTVTREGKIVGVVQMIRLQRDAAGDEEFVDDFITGFLQEYAETDKVGKGVIAGQDVHTIKDARKTGAGVVAWLDDRDFVVVLAVDGLPAARRLARQYLAAG